jgi:hypothetical protein
VHWGRGGLMEMERDMCVSALRPRL